MLKDYSSSIGIMLLGIALIVVIGTYYRIGYLQDATTLGLTETVRAAAIDNADYSSRLEPGNLFILKNQFESDFEDRIYTNNNVKISEGAEYTFEYLDNDNGSTKAIKVSIIDGEKEYSATYIVNIADSQG